ncbi:GNAT family N-acetyltransferase [Deltaproteobacteria bacterium]|nr:GNAT family N-acetyltransferase [Deltaproteobacteria bacterium]
MGNRGRFGKYGDIKRLDCLRCARSGAHLSGGEKTIKRLRTRQSSGQCLHHSPDVIVRPTDGSETRFIKRLSRKLFNLYGPYEEIIPRWFESNMTMTVIALVNGQPVGFAMTGELIGGYDFQHAVELLAIAVDPKNQGIGVGKLLLRELERKTEELGLNRLYLHTATKNYRAQKLFARMGYRTGEIKKSFYPEGQDAFVMYKELLKIFLNR